MTVNKFVAFSSICALTLPAGVAREKDDAFHGVQHSVQERTGKAVRWEEDQVTREQALQDVRQLLRNPLTVDTAVQIALLNNRSLQMTFEEIGLSAADLLQAATIPNPNLSLAIRFPDKPPSGTYSDANVAIDFLSIIMIPLKKRVAKDELEATALRVADDTLELILQVKRIFFSLQASQQLLQRFQLIVETNAASLDLAQRQHEAGNISDLALARQQASYSRSRLEVATTEAEIRRDREKLNRLLGLWGSDTDWQIAGKLPDVPSSEPNMRGLERLAVSQRLDLQADYLQVASQTKDLSLTKSFRLLGALEFGPETERETDGQQRTGPTFAIELPVFNQGQPRIARGEAARRQAQDKFEALAVDVRSQIRELRDELTSKREIARFYQEELVPNERRILNQSLSNYNAMEISDFQLFTTRAEEAQTEREYVEAVRDYWITRAELERAVGGSLRPRQAGEGKATPVSNPRPTR
ncbi:MAG TPA: TolC family protein [Chthoniobacterales bacterium]|nr:TolC family protein [Chthoniobacterales bacterium]